jgi:hypothetical protein
LRCCGRAIPLLLDFFVAGGIASAEAENGGKFDVRAEKERTKKPSEQNSEGFGAADGT